MKNSSDEFNLQEIGDSYSIFIPAFGKSSAISFETTMIREADSRLIEAKDVNPITYSELESVINNAYRDLKRYLTKIGYEITLADKAMEEAKSDIVLDKYPAFMQGRPKSHDNSDMRKAFMMRDQAYIAALDRFNQLKALESYFDGKIKVLENTSRYMKKKMDLILRSGVSSDLYITSGGKNGQR